MKWIQNNALKIASYTGGGLIATGALMLIPKSPWTLIVIGVLVLFFVFVSLVDDNIY
jgi:hypothetical protein